MITANKAISSTYHCIVLLKQIVWSGCLHFRGSFYTSWLNLLMPGILLSIQMLSCWYSKFHSRNNTILHQSYLHSKIPKLVRLQLYCQTNTWWCMYASELSLVKVIGWHLTLWKKFNVILVKLFIISFRKMFWKCALWRDCHFFQTPMVWRCQTQN